MKPLLFKAKMALLSFLISGLVLVCFGVFFLVSLHKVGLARIDREILALGESQLRGEHPEAFWAGFDDSLDFMYGAENQTKPFVIVINSHGKRLFCSDHLPVGADNLKLPAPRETPRSAHARKTPSPEHFIRRLDRDGNGKVSRLEFDGPPDAFDHEDQNRDGFLSREEVQRMQERTMGPRRPPLEHSGPARPPLGEQGPGRIALTMREPQFENLETERGAWRVGILGNDVITIAIGVSLNDFHAEANRFTRFFLVATPMALLLLAISGWILASRAMYPIGLITRTAESISAKDMSQRVPPTHADAELVRLTRVINDMLERLERSYHQAIRFSGDAAHELQTPLAILQGELDHAVQTAAPGSEEQQRCSQLLEEVHHLKTVTQKLLLLARADAGRLVLKLVSVNLSALVNDAIDDARVMAPDRQIEQDIEPALFADVDEPLLQQAILNMITNAVKYGTQGGLLRFELRAANGMTNFTLSNEGTPIPATDRDKVFDRFHRVDKAHPHRLGGSGLGLSLAREITLAHGGDLVLNPDRDGLTSFTLTTPLHH